MTLHMVTAKEGLQEIKKFQLQLDEINRNNKFGRFIIVSVDFDDIKYGKCISTQTCDYENVVEEISKLIYTIENWENGDSYHYSTCIIYNNEVIFEFNTSDIEELEEY